MRREHRDELLRGFLAINAMLREEAKALRRAIDAKREEAKHNPNWRLQPRAPRGHEGGGRWVTDGSQVAPSTELLNTFTPDLPLRATAALVDGWEDYVDTNGLSPNGSTQHFPTHRTMATTCRCLRRKS